MIHLDPEERIVKIIRKHWFIPATELVVAVIGAIAPLFILGLAGGVLEGLGIGIDHERSVVWIAYGYSIWLIFIWMHLTTRIMDHHLDAWVITNKRVIDVEQKGMWRHEVSSFRLDLIQDITVDISGVVATFLDYGTIHVQTAGERRMFEMRHAPHPEAMKTAIREASDRAFERMRGIPSVPSSDPSRFKIPE